jgi:hypothetical protein
MSNGNYNYIYKELVEDKDDILGIIAYSFYKRQKIEFIERYKLQHDGKDPMDADLSPFHDLSNSPSQLENYRNQAVRLAQEFLETALSEEMAELQKKYAEDLAHELKSASPGFWYGVAQGFVASIIFVLFLGVVVFFTWASNQGLRQVIENVFNVQVIPQTNQIESTKQEKLSKP